MDGIPSKKGEALGNEVPTTSTSKPESTEVDWEKRYKDTQKFVEERAIEAKRLQAEKDSLAKQLAEMTKPAIEVPAEVDELKFSDPEKWRHEINKLEQQALDEATTKQREVLDAASKEAADQAELDRRLRVLTDFTTNNPSLKIDEQVLANDVPPSISRKLENGEVSFEQYLEDVKAYLTSVRVPPKEEVMDDPNLSKVPGKETVSKEAIKGEAITSYANELY